MSLQFRLRQFRTESEMRGTLAAVRVFVLAILKRVLTPKRPDFDKQYGTVTQEVVEVADGEIPADGFDTAVRYVATSPEVIGHICRKLPIDHRDYHFIDMGCGRGRTLLLASDYPFRSIVGVEISPLHAEIARNNVAIYRSPRQVCDDISVVRQNATEYIPPRGNLVVYMYQPFGGPILRSVLEILETSAGDQYPVFLCFAAPYQVQDVIIQNPYFELIEHFPTFGNTDDAWTMYGNAKAAGLVPD